MPIIVVANNLPCLPLLAFQKLLHSCVVLFQSKIVPWIGTNKYGRHGCTAVDDIFHISDYISELFE